MAPIVLIEKSRDGVGPRPAAELWVTSSSASPDRHSVTGPPWAITASLTRCVGSAEAHGAAQQHPGRVDTEIVLTNSLGHRQRVGELDHTRRRLEDRHEHQAVVEISSFDTGRLHRPDPEVPGAVVQQPSGGHRGAVEPGAHHHFTEPDRSTSAAP